MAIQDDPNALRVGSKIAGYEVLRVIGSGGFGITYEAASPVTGKHVAIKEFFPRGIASREESTRIVFAARDADLAEWALKRFESSTTDQCKLKHPNIVEVIHYVKDNDTGYMIMEYVEGETLEQWLRKRGTPPSTEELKTLIDPIFAALEYLHDRKLIHRDIAPDNIMVRADGTPVIIDFGAIKMIEQQTQLRSKTNRSFTVSKQFYSPPEQVEDNADKLDARADVYALAATIYRALAGRPPASAEERTQKIAFGNGDPLVPLATLAPRVSADFAAAVDRGLAFNARDRISSVVLLREALGWSGSSSNAATVAVSGVSSEPRFQTFPSSAPVPRSIAVPKRASSMRWLASGVVVATLLGAVVILGGGRFDFFSARGPATIVRESQPVPVPQVATAPETKAATPQQQPPAAKENKSDPLADARRDFEIAQRIDTRLAYEQFLMRYSDGFYAQLARAQLQRLANLSAGEITAKLQTELRRVGCSVSAPDGVWGEDSRKALLAFNQHAATKFDVAAPSNEALDAVRAKPSRVCPLVCAAGQRVQGDTCVAACAPGFALAQNGACVRLQAQPQPQPAAKNPQRLPAQPNPNNCYYADRALGEYNSRVFCQPR